MLYMYVLYVTIVGTLLLHMYSSLISLNYVVRSPEYRAHTLQKLSEVIGTFRKAGEKASRSPKVPKVPLLAVQNRNSD